MRQRTLLLISLTAALLMAAAAATSARAQAADFDVILPPPPVTVSSTHDLVSAWRQARPGSVIRLRPGTYRLKNPLAGQSGAPGMPITIAAADPENPPVFKPTTGDALKLSSIHHVELQDLVIAGSGENGLNIDDGQTYESPSTHVTLRRIVASTPVGGGNRDAIKISGVHNLIITDSQVTAWADGGSGIDLVRCKGVMISDNTISNQPGRGHTGIQAKGVSENVRITRNQFIHAGERAVQIGGATGRKFLVNGEMPYEAKDITVADNVFHGGMVPVAFVSSQGGTFSHNTVVNPGRWIVRILQENRSNTCVPANGGVIERNLIVYDADKVQQAVNVGPGTKPATFQFRENFWYARDAPQRSRPQLPSAEVDGVYGQDPRLTVDGHKVQLADDSPAAAYGAAARAVE